jgi:hypothetical protein
MIVGPTEYLTRPNARSETNDEMAARQRDLENMAKQEGRQKMIDMYMKAARNIQRERKPGLKGVLTVCHSTGQGFLRNALDKILGDHGGAIAVFRMRASAGEAVFASDAGHVAGRWAPTLLGEKGSPIAPGEPSNYSRTKAFFSAFGSHVFGPGASQRAAVYRKHKDTPGGPPSDSSTGAHPRKKGFFCSMFVIACYHAAFPTDDLRKKYLPLDARYTSPMTLDGYLRTRGAPWRLVGTIP